MNKTLSAENLQTGNRAAILVIQRPPSTACTRPPIRFEFQSYVRVVIFVRGAGVLRRTLVGG